MYVQKKVVNPQVCLESICCVTFAALMLYLVSTGSYQSYVTPRMAPYFYFTSAVMALWALGGLFRLFRPRHRIRATHCFVLAIPALLLLLPHSPINSADLSGGYFISGAPSDLREDESASDLPGLDVNNRKIIVSNDDFGLWFFELYSNADKYRGYTITMTGFVFKDPEIVKKDEFVPARLAMTCCVADLSPVGLLCEYDGASGLKENSWVTVEGTIFTVKIKYDDGQGYDEPHISVTKIIPALKADGYIYPY